MFGTKLHLITVLYLILELVILIIQISVCLTRPKDTERIRFFILILLFIIFNLCNGLFPNLEYGLTILSQLIIAYASGIALVTYYFYYLTKELNITTDRFYNSKFLIISSLISFFVGFGITYLVTGDINFSKQVFIVPPLFIALYFCIRTIIFIFINQQSLLSHFKILTLSGYIGIVFMASMPIVAFFGDNQTIMVGLINISFLLSAIAYYKIYLYQGNMEFEVLNDIGYFSPEQKEENPPKLNDPFAEFGLTSREMQVFQLILKNLSYAEISEILHIVENTVSKHASNIFKKTKCSNKRELIAKFSE